jgi:hypothetical protein
MKYCNLLFMVFIVALVRHFFFKSNLNKYEFLQVYIFY